MFFLICVLFIEGVCIIGRRVSMVRIVVVKIRKVFC